MPAKELFGKLGKFNINLTQKANFDGLNRVTNI